MILRYDQGMNTHHEPIDHNHPAALAREVLDAHTAWGKTAAGSDECTRATEAFTDAVNRSGLNLARAVIRMEALADRLDNEADYEASRGDTWDATCIRAEARRIRKALNGDDQ